MMMKSFISTTRSVLNISKAGLCHESSSVYNLLRAATFSHQSQGIHHNVDKPFERSEPKITKQISVEDPFEEPQRNDDPWRSKTDQDLSGNLSDFATDKPHYNNDPHKSKTEDLSDKAKKGTKSAVETAFDVGATLAEGMEQSWGGLKETTKKVKDTVVGNNDNEHHGGGDHGHVDKHVEDLRRKAGGYDQKYR